MNSKAVGKRALLGMALTICAAVLWGSTYPVIQIGLGYYTPYQISLFRAVFATLALLAYFVVSPARRSQLRLPGSSSALALLVGASLFGAAGFWTLLNLSIVFLEADTSSFLVALYPLITIVFAAAILKDRITPIRVLGVVMGIVGTYAIVVLGEQAQVTGSMPLEGSLLALGAAFSWSFYMICTRILIGTKDRKTGIAYTPEFVTLTTFLVSLVPTSAIVLFTGLPGASASNSEGLAAVVYLGVATSAFAFLIFNVGMKIIGVSRAAVNQMLFPAVTIVLSYFMLGETVNFLELGGITVIVVGVVVAQRFGG